MFEMILATAATVAGLAAFETINSVDNAVINADVLGTMSRKARKWFLLWGMLFAVFVVRGLLPWVIVWVSAGDLGPIEALVATFSSDPHAAEAIHEAAPMLLMGAGMFLILLFLHWLFMEDKEFGLPHEAFVMSHSVWFYSIASVLLCGVVWAALRENHMRAFGAVAGSTAFFITLGFKDNAEHMEKQMISGKAGHMSDWSKILFLEIIDTCFSIDGVLGAFAFTFSVPLILVGNGIGAIIVRQLTVGNMERIKRLRYLKNGAMYSVLALGIVMLAEAFGAEIPQWISPMVTFAVIGYFLWKSLVAAKGIK